METQKKLEIKAKWCKGCGICVAFCPKGVLDLESNKVIIKNGDSCVKCGMCELRCPDYAIYLELEESTK